MYARLAIFGVLFFFAGFFAHALFFPYLFVDGDLKEAKKEVQGVVSKRQYPDERNDFITYINYENGRFRPSQVTIQRGNYIAITNRDEDELMQLSSSEKMLATVRGYASGERLQTAINEPGTYRVVNALNARATLTITVK